MQCWLTCLLRAILEYEKVAKFEHCSMGTFAINRNVKMYFSCWNRVKRIKLAFTLHCTSLEKGRSRVHSNIKNANYSSLWTSASLNSCTRKHINKWLSESKVSKDVLKLLIAWQHFLIQTSLAFNLLFAVMYRLKAKAIIW